MRSSGFCGILTAIACLGACDNELGPPPVLDDIYCTDLCAQERFGLPDLATCLDWCEQEPTLTPEHLNCMVQRGRPILPPSRITGCEALLGPFQRP